MDVMAPHEVREFVAHNRFGMLGLAAEGSAYVVPLFYGFDGVSVYFSTRPGLKSRFMGATREACFAIARVVAFDDWASVEVFGRLEEVRSGPELTAAMNALMSVPLPPEWGVSGFGEPRHGDVGASIYRLVPREMSGRRSRPPPRSPEEKEIAFGGCERIGGAPRRGLAWRAARGGCGSDMQPRACVRTGLISGADDSGRARVQAPVRRRSASVRHASFRTGRTVKCVERLLLRTLPRRARPR